MMGFQGFHPCCGLIGASERIEIVPQPRLSSLLNRVAQGISQRRVVILKKTSPKRGEDFLLLFPAKKILKWTWDDHLVLVYGRIHF